MLEIEPDDRSEDVRLAFWLRLACGVIESYLGHPVYRQERTEYYGGSSTQRLVLRSRPAYADPLPRVWVDEAGRFGAASGGFAANQELTYGADFSLWLDHGTDPARSDRAILIRNSGLWNKAAVRQAGYLAPFVGDNPGTVKVVYTGGYYAEDLPQEMVLACVQTVARLRFMMPTGLPVGSDSYEGASVHIGTNERNWLLGQSKHLLFRHKGRRF